MRKIDIIFWVVVILLMFFITVLVLVFSSSLPMEIKVTMLAGVFIAGVALLNKRALNRADRAVDSVFSGKELPEINGTIIDVKRSTFTVIMENYLPQALFILAVSAGLFALVLYATLRSHIGVTVIYFIFPLGIPILAYERFRSKVYSVFMSQFARANNFKFHREGKFNRGADGSIFKIGHSKRVYNVVEGTFLNYPLRVFHYEYTASAGKNDKTYYNTVFSITFPKNMPHLYLDSTSHNKALYVSGFETINLESNRFNDEFRLFMKKGEHIPALQIFTPDVMAKIIDLPGRADVEFVGKNIYIYEDHLIGTKKELEETFELAKYLVHNMDYVLKSMNYKDPNEKGWDIIGSI